MTSDGNNCYTYNDANQLSQVKNCTTNQVIAQYVYDYQGNRIEKKVYNSGSLQKTVYSPDKTYETVKQATVSATTGIWTTGSASDWAAAIVSFNSAGSTPAVVQKVKNEGGGTGSVATSFTSNVTSGNAIVVMTITGSATTLDTTSVTDNQSNTYTQIGTTQHTPGRNYLRVWYAKNVTGGSVTVTSHQSGSATGVLMEMLEYSGLSTTAPADQSASATGNSTSPSGGSITPTNNNALVISAFIDDNSDNVSITGTSGYTVEESDVLNSTSTRNGIEDKVLTTGAATANTSYYYVNDQLAAKKNSDGTKNYYYDDNLHSTSVLANQSGTVVENSTYYPFGQIRSGGTQSKYLFTGQENDPETNLDYYNARYYNPGNMHFTQPDSYTASVYNPQDLNEYSYVENNPVTYTDPTGHVLEDACILECGAFFLSMVGTAPDTSMDIQNLSQDTATFMSNPSVGNGVAVALSAASVAVPDASVGKGSRAVGRVIDNGISYFNNMTTFRRYLGSAGDAMHWGHFVEQNKTNIEQFGKQQIHNTLNVIKMDAPVNRAMNKIYSTKPQGSALTNRQIINQKPYVEQFKFAVKTYLQVMQQISKSHKK